MVSPQLTILSPQLTISSPNANYHFIVPTHHFIAPTHHSIAPIHPSTAIPSACSTSHLDVFLCLLPRQSVVGTDDRDVVEVLDLSVQSHGGQYLILDVRLRQQRSLYEVELPTVQAAIDRSVPTRVRIGHGHVRDECSDLRIFRNVGEVSSDGRQCVDDDLGRVVVLVGDDNRHGHVDRMWVHPAILSRHDQLIHVGFLPIDRPDDENVTGLVIDPEHVTVRLSRLRWHPVDHLSVDTRILVSGGHFQDGRPQR